MFAATTQDHLSASALAGAHLNAWEKTLAFRVSLQKPLDLANQLPVHSEQDDNLKALSEQLRGQMYALSDLLEQQLHPEKAGEKSAKKSKAAGSADADELWEQMYKQQNELQTTRWEPVLNKWHARLNFGSEKTKAKLKVFTQSMWNQVEDTLTDEHRSISKSRMPWEESRRLDKHPHSTEESERGDQESKNDWSAPLSASSASTSVHSSSKSATDGNKRAVQEVYDHEVYDDRMFYAMLLKTFITSASNGSSGSGGAGAGDQAGVMGTMRAGDLEALRQYKRKKLNVERKASKGRKVRYNVHDKLQNFMFPIGGSLALTENISIDSEKLFQSLFQ